MVYCEGEILGTAEQIIEAVLANQRLVATTEIENDRYTALLMYPVKTVNANEREKVYQTDTGPVLFPDLSRDSANLMDGLELAFAAFNCPHWTEFLVRVKTRVTDDVSVYHYSQPVRVDAKNQVIRI